MNSRWPPKSLFKINAYRWNVRKKRSIILGQLGTIRVESVEIEREWERKEKVKCKNRLKSNKGNHRLL